MKDSDRKTAQEGAVGLAPGAPRTPARRSRVAVLREWLKVFGLGSDQESELREDIEEAIEERREAQAPIDPQERLMLLNILRLGELRIADIMIPRADIVAVSIDTSLTDIVKLFTDAEHSRLPVYRETLDEVIGMVHLKDVFKLSANARAFTFQAILRKILFVPPSMRVLDLLKQMQATRVHMAMVVDEYGGIDGLVTIENLVEQIVGEIEDEHDVGIGEMLIERADGSFDADGRTPLDMVIDRLELDLAGQAKEEEVDTLAGLVQAISGRVPQRGELIRHPLGLEFEILEADPRRVKRLRIRRFLPPAVEP